MYQIYTILLSDVSCYISRYVHLRRVLTRLVYSKGINRWSLAWQARILSQEKPLLHFRHTIHNILLLSSISSCISRYVRLRRVLTRLVCSKGINRWVGHFQNMLFPFWKVFGKMQKACRMIWFYVSRMKVLPKQRKTIF